MLFFIYLGFHVKIFHLSLLCLYGKTILINHWLIKLKYYLENYPSPAKASLLTI